MAVVHLERVDFLSAKEQFGALTEVSMRARVTGLVDADYQTLFTALASAGVPAANSKLPGAPNLVLTERNPTLIEKGVVDIDLVYTKFNNAGQNFSKPFKSTMTGRVRVSVNQVTGNTDFEGSPVTVSHTYPADDPTFPKQKKTQGGEFKFFQAQRSFSIEGVLQTSRPWLIANSIIGKVNAFDFSGEPPRTWMCTGANWEIFDTSTVELYSMAFEFQHNPDSWDPTVIFIDERTGKPPENLVKDIGFKTVKKHTAVDFEEVLAVRIQSG